MAIRDPRSGNLLHTLRGHRNTVESLAFSPDGTVLASGAAGDSVRLWDAARAMEVAVLELTSVNQISFAIWLAFDPRGHYLAANALVWDLHSKSLVGVFLPVSETFADSSLPMDPLFCWGLNSGRSKACSLAGIECTKGRPCNRTAKA